MRDRIDRRTDRSDGDPAVVAGEPPGRGVAIPTLDGGGIDRGALCDEGDDSRGSGGNGAGLVESATTGPKTRGGGKSVVLLIDESTVVALDAGDRAVVLPGVAAGAAGLLPAGSVAGTPAAAAGSCSVNKRISALRALCVAFGGPSEPLSVIETDEDSSCEIWPAPTSFP